jgi:hypothetical protein
MGLFCRSENIQPVKAAFVGAQHAAPQLGNQVTARETVKANKVRSAPRAMKGKLLGRWILLLLLRTDN